jgi:hypothetical protein
MREVSGFTVLVFLGERLQSGRKGTKGMRAESLRENLLIAK